MEKVYMTKEISPESLIKVYERLGVKLNGKVGIKISTGEPGGHNFLNPNLIKDLVQSLNGTIIECNTAYKGRRFTSEEHRKAIEEHGFTKIANVDIMDEEDEMVLPLENGKHLKENIVGGHLKDYGSILILSHFKGHVMGGFGGALKNISIGIASTKGKVNIHTAGITTDPNYKEIWETPQNDFLESMAEAVKTVVDYEKENMIYINVVNNLSVDCDCDSNPEDPCMKDIGILSSKDPVALDKACLDLIYNSKDAGRDHLVERIDSRNGIHTVDYAEKLGIGTQEYELINID